MNEVYEATISNMFAYEVYMLACEHIAKMVEYPDFHDWGKVDAELRRAMHVRKGIEKRFPQFVGSETEKEANALIEKAKKRYEEYKKAEEEALRRRYNYGKVGDEIYSFIVEKDS